MTSLRSGLLSHVGRVRESNQDSGLATDNLVVVADGMGGHRGGETASRIAVEIMREVRVIGSLDELVAAVEAANAAVFEASQRDPRLDGMGTTLTAIGIVDDGEGSMLGVVNVGDSRTYLFHDGDLQALTEDHSMVATLLREGQITEDEALRHPHRNILTRALGVEATVDVDSWTLAPVAGDRLVLCSDGLVNEVSDEQIAAVLRRLSDPDEAAAELVRMANENGGRDNVTVAVVDLVDLSNLLTASALEPTAPHPVAAVDDDTPVAALTSAGRGFDEPAPPRERASRITWRVVVFALAVVAVVAVAVAALARDDSDDERRTVDTDEPSTSSGVQTSADAGTAPDTDTTSAPTAEPAPPAATTTALDEAAAIDPPEPEMSSTMRPASPSTTAAESPG